MFVCALAVHAGSVRLMFAMARDNNLPFAHALAHVHPWSKAPIVPSVVVGVLAAAILVLNINLPQRDRDALLGRHRLGQPGVPPGDVTAVGGATAAARCERSRTPAPVPTCPSSEPGRARSSSAPLLLAGPVGMPDQRDRGRLGPVRRHQYQLAASGDLRLRTGWGRFAAPLATLGPDRRRHVSTFLSFSISGAGILAEHAARCYPGGEPFVAAESAADRNALGSVNWHPAEYGRRDLDADATNRESADRAEVGGHGQAPGAKTAEDVSAARARPPGRFEQFWAGACMATRRWAWWRPG